MRLYIVRHGEALSNIDKSEYERTPNVDIPLTENGKVQAREAAEKIYRDLCPIAPQCLIYTSPYERAKQTALLIQEKFENSCLRENLLLAEWNCGIACGLSLEEYIADKKDQQELFFKMGKLFTKLPQGECLADVAVRAELFLHRILRRFKIDPTIIVSHQGFCCMLHAQITDVATDSHDWENGEVRLYDADRVWPRYKKRLGK